MLQPKKTKYRKAQKGRMKGNSGRGHRLSNGMFGIKSLDSNFLTSRQIEAARIAATRYMKREGQLWIKIFPDKPITKKPLEVRMGKGVAFDKRYKGGNMTGAYKTINKIKKGLGDHPKVADALRRANEEFTTKGE